MYVFIIIITLFTFSACKTPNNLSEETQIGEVPSSSAAPSSRSESEPSLSSVISNNAEVTGDVMSEMTSDNQEYFNKYLSCWGAYCPFVRSYTEESFAEDFAPYMLFYSSAAQENMASKYDAEYFPDYPANIVEDTVLRHFPVTVEQFRAKLASRSTVEYYEAEKDVYHFEGGFGGPDMPGVVTKSEREGDELRLWCSWYDINDSTLLFAHTVTIRLGDTENEFFYAENDVYETGSN
jgi:hypothetical protein